MGNIFRKETAMLTLIHIDDTRNLDELKNALIEMGNFDADMNGKNGPEYLWDDAKRKGYKSNNAYLASKVLVQPYSSPEELFTKFAEEFYDKNSDYYSCEWEIEFLKDGNSLTVAYAINPWD